MATSNAFKLSTQWTDLNSLTGFAIGSRIIIQNHGKASDVIEIKAQESEPVPGESGMRINNAEPYVLQAQERVWCRYVRFGSSAGIDDRSRLLFSAEPVSSSLVTPLSGLSELIANPFRSPRLKVNSLTAGQQYVVDGIGYVTTWREDSILAAPASDAWAEFTIPEGYYMALDSRLFKGSADSLIYRVFPEGTYVPGAAKTDDALSFGFTRNMRTGAAIPAIAAQHLIRQEAPTTAPADTDFIIFEDLFGQKGKGSNISSGGIDSDSAFLLLSPGQKFLLRITNAGEVEAKTVVKLTYAFIPEAAIPPTIFA